MRLNLWMVANCLYVLKPTVMVPSNAPADLIGVRSTYASDCAYIYQRNGDVIIDAGEKGGYLVFENADFRETFEMAQFAFDFFNEREEQLQNAVERLDYKQIIDLSWFVFRNPMILLDAGNKVLYMSEQYGENDVNEDWKYLKLHGRSSLEVQEYLLEIGANNDYFMNERARIYSFDDPYINADELSVAIFYNNMNYGRLNVIEKDRELNPGDLLLADHIIEYLSTILGKLNIDNQSARGEHQFVSIYAKLLEHRPVSQEEMEYWKKTSGWKKGYSYRVIVCKINGINTSINYYQNVENLIRTFFDNTGGITQLEDHFCFLINEKEEQGEERWQRLIDFAKRFDLEIGVSLTIQNIEKLYCYYDQAMQVLKYGVNTGAGENIYYFFDYAIDYILTAKNLEYARFACQVDVIHMWENDKKGGGDTINTLNAYLTNERSLIKAANALFIHRNTLVYRINKILGMMVCDVNDSYTREYMRLSIRICRLYQERER